MLKNKWVPAICAVPESLFTLSALRGVQMSAFIAVIVRYFVLTWHLCGIWLFTKFAHRGVRGDACRRRIVRVEEAMHTGGAASASVRGGRSGWTVEHRMCCQKTIASRTIGGCSCTGRENFRSFSEYLLVVFGFINYYTLVSNICKYMCKCNIDIFLDTCLIWSVTFRFLDTPYSCTLQSVSTHSTFHNIFSYSPYLKRLFLY